MTGPAQTGLHIHFETIKYFLRDHKKSVQGGGIKKISRLTNVRSGDILQKRKGTLVRKLGREIIMKTVNRRQESRAVYALFSLLLLAGLMLTIFLCIHSTVDAAETKRYKYFTHILVEKGDSLWDIAGKYISDEYGSRSQYIEELCNINHLSGKQIYAGEVLIVPYYDGAYK